MTTVGPHWATQNRDPGQPVIQPTPGDALERPYTALSVSATDQLDWARVSADARTIFPVFDGRVNLMPGRPAEFASPGAASFMTWHAAHQLEYLNTHGSLRTLSDDIGDLSARVATVPGPPDLTVFLTQDGRQAITLATLRPTDIALLSLEDQRVLAALPEFLDTIAPAFNLRPAVGDAGPEAVRDALKADIAEIRTRIEASPAFVPDRQALFESDPAARRELYHYFFLAQLDILETRLDRMAIFEPDAINELLAGLGERYLRLERYQSMTAEIPASDSTLPRNVNTSDGGTSVASAAEIFLGVEARLYDIARARFDLAETGEFNGRPADVPQMIFILQSLATRASEAEAEGKTEELNQNNILLKDYSRMQDILNRTLKLFADRGSDAEVSVAAYGSLAEVSPEDRAVISMFNEGTMDAANTFHPVESERSVLRPLLDMLGTPMATHPKDVWDRFSLNLGEATQQIGRDSQIRMQEIARMNEQKNRHYEMGSNVLSRTAEIIRSILI
jgi:hypothetical protein